MKGAVAEAKALERAAESHAKSPGKKDRLSESEVSDSDEQEQEQAEDKAPAPKSDPKKKRRGLKKKKSGGEKVEEKEDDNISDNESDKPTRTWIEEPVVKMSMREAEKILKGTIIDNFK